MALSNYSSTPASNTSINGIGIAGSNSPSNFDNALRQLMADIADMQQRDGSAGTPAYTFASDTDIGFYRVAANSLGVTIGGTLRGGWTTGRFYTTVPMQTSDGSAASPSFAFDTDPDNGLFLAGANAVGFSTGGTQRMQLNTGELVVGKTIIDIGTAGVAVTTSGQTIATASSATPLVANRKTDDGSLVDLYQDGVLEGSISVSGTTVSYGGGHLGRFAQWDGLPMAEPLRGTVMANTGELCEWEGEANEQLTKVRVSNVAGEKAVYGILERVDDDGDILLAGGGGEFLVRIADSVSFALHDLLESAGDGTARPQADDIVRTSTIAEVTSLTVQTVYPDGSRLVPCLLRK